MSNNKDKLQQEHAVLEDILDHQMRLNEILDKKAHFIMGIAGIILTIIVAEVLPNLDKFNDLEKIGIAIISCGCILSLILTIKIIDPIMGDRERTDLFYYKSFLKNYDTGEDYAKDLKKLLNNEDEIIKLYAMQIYDLSDLVLKPNFYLLKITSRILLIGIIVGSIFVFIPTIKIYLTGLF